VLRLLENLVLRLHIGSIDGPLRLEPSVFEAFRRAPYDVLPNFQGPPGSRLRGGRGKDHPRYGRFVYSLARVRKPERVVEVGSYAGGTAVGWARALHENGAGKLICVDNDTYAKGTYPTITRRNILATGIDESRFELRNGDSMELVRDLASEHRGRVDLYLVDGDHTYEGAMADMVNGYPMLRPSGLMLVHDVDPDREMREATPQHPHPVLDAFREFADQRRLTWCILKFIRKHLGVLECRPE